jgi:hypothetical protein
VSWFPALLVGQTSRNSSGQSKPMKMNDICMILDLNHREMLANAETLTILQTFACGAIAGFLPESDTGFVASPGMMWASKEKDDHIELILALFRLLRNAMAVGELWSTILTWLMFFFSNFFVGGRIFFAIECESNNQVITMKQIYFISCLHLHHLN